MVSETLSKEASPNLRLRLQCNTNKPSPFSVTTMPPEGLAVLMRTTVLLSPEESVVRPLLDEPFTPLTQDSEKLRVYSFQSHSAGLETEQMKGGKGI